MEAIILIGIAGCGKTTFCKKILSHHVRISLDEIKRHNRKKEYKLIRENLEQGNSIVIDDTNLTRQIRRVLIQLIHQYNARVVGVFFDLSIHRIQIQNQRREKSLPSHVLFKMKKMLESPSEDEGFDFIQILDDNFVF